jgi:hypothetical protein
MTRFLALALISCATSLSANHPCALQNPEYRAVLAECAARVRMECKNISDDECPVVAECDALVEKRCAE